MIIKREGRILSVELSSGIGYSLHFNRTEGSDADAEAWRVHLQRHQDRQDEFARNAKFHAENEKCELQAQIRRLKRALQYHKRKHKNGKADR